ncbi:MAG: HEAT repeat domain-containing protein [Cyanobacteria bacterium P01_A01_bin.123]
MHQPAFRPSTAYANAAPNKILMLALEGLVSGDFQRQWEAAKQLREVGEVAIAPLVDLTQNDTIDEDIRWFAARTLGEFDHPQALAALAQLLSDEDEELNQIAAAALAQIGPSAIHPLSYLLQSDSTRLLAVQALAQIRQRRTIAPLLRVVNDRDSQVRQIAIEALASFQDSRILPVLVQALDDSSAGVRKEAVTGLGLRFKWQTGKQASVVDGPDLDRDESNRANSDGSCSTGGDFSSHDLGFRLAACLHDVHLDVCAKAAAALGRWGTPYAVACLGTVLSQPRTAEALKHQLIQSLGWIPTLAAVDAIAPVLTMPEVPVRYEAIRTLSTVEIPDLRERATQYLLSHLDRQPTILEKQSIALGLARLGCDQALNGILSCLADDHEGVQLHAIAALKQLNTVDGYQYLQHLSQMSELTDTLRIGVQKALAEW